MAEPRSIEGIDASTPFAEAGAVVVETRAAELLAHSDGVLDVERIEGVHDMRVATRRLRAALEVFSACFPKAQHRAVLKEVKAIADALGERRDRDVAIEALEGIAESVATPDRRGIRSLADRYRAEQATANEALGPFVEAARLQRLQEAVVELTEAARANLDPVEEDPA